MPTGKPDQPRQAIFNDAAQAWNHEFFWDCLAPSGGGAPPETRCAQPRAVLRHAGSVQGAVRRGRREAVRQRLALAGRQGRWIAHRDDEQCADSVAWRRAGRLLVCDCGNTPTIWTSSMNGKRSSRAFSTAGQLAVRRPRMARTGCSSPPDPVPRCRISGRGDRASPGSARPAASSPCPFRDGTVCDCRWSSTARVPSSRLPDRRCVHRAPSHRSRADRGRAS